MWSTQSQSRSSKAIQRRRRPGESHTFEQLESRICLAASPEWLGDLNALPLSPHAGQFLAAEDFVFFTAEDPQHGNELWRTDGTAQGTLFVKDINPGPAGSSISLTSDGNYPSSAIDGSHLYFVADDGVHGPELWRSDGTEEGTFLLKDVFPGREGSYPNWFRFVGSTLFFAANEPKVGRELWKSDGTVEGTVLVKDISLGDSGSDPTRGNELNGRLIFVARDNEHGLEMWSSDGTERGTFLLKDINSTGDGVKYSCGHGRCSFPPVKHPTLNRIFFTGMDGKTEAEPWVTDGTEAGTFLLRDINPDRNSPSDPTQAIAVGDSLFFAALDGTGTRNLWRSDGTRGGTVLFGGGVAPSVALYPANIAAAGEILYFTGFDNSHGQELWQSDGTTQGTVLMDINPQGGSYPEPRGVLGHTFFFSADDGQTGRELWKANEQGAMLVKDINPQGSSYPMWTAPVGEQLIFAVRDNVGELEVWATNEDASHVVLLHQGRSSNYVYSGGGVSWEGQVFFTGGDGQVWRTDGTPDGTRILRNDSRTQGSSPHSFVHYQGKNYFLAHDGNRGGLYVHDPSSAGDQLVKRFAEGDVTALQVFRDRLVFLNNGALWFSDGTTAGTARLARTSSLKAISAGDDVVFMTTNEDLWKSDGTEEGTVLVKRNIDGGTYQTAYPQELTAIGNTLFFSAYHTRFGRELWQSDGTAAGTVVRDLGQGSFGSYPTSLAAVGGRLLFAADDGQHGRELWTSDGTADGTKLVADLDARELSSGSDPGQFFRSGDAVYFVARNANGQQAIWHIRDDAPATATLLVDELSDVYGLADFHGRLLFTANRRTANGPTLWIANEGQDGVTDVSVGKVYSPANVTISGNTVYFTGWAPQGGNELWKTDGTRQGTVLVSDINRSGGGSYPSDLTAVDGRLYFAAHDGSSGRELWMSDGTRTGTIQVKDINLGERSSYPTELRRFGQSLLFSADDVASGRELWISDGTAEGTRLVTDLREEATNGAFADQFTHLGVWTYFVADDGIHGSELWKTDGTASGTILVTEIQPGPADAHIDSMQAVGDRLFFAAISPRTGARTLWMSDGSAAGTVEVRTGIMDPRDFAVLNGQLYFSAVGSVCCNRDLYRVEITSSGATLKKVANLFPRGSADPTNLTVVGDQLFFVADDGIHGRELWQTDGTEAGTKLVVDIFNSVYTASAPGQFEQVGGLVYFTAQDPSNGTELWVTDGTISGTHMVADVWAGSGSSSPLELTEMNGKLVFSADDGSRGRELWISDGTPGGTLQIRDINARYSNSSNPQSLLNVGDHIYFFAESAASGVELWRSNGTRGGTTMVKDINTGRETGAVSLPDQLVAIDTTVYFVATDGTNGRELWKSDGTGDGTVMVQDVRPGGSGSISTDPARHKLVPLGSQLYFAADSDGRRGAELWVTDGTDTETVMVFDPSASASGLLPLDAIGDWLYFSASGNDQGVELWRTDGTVSNTVQVADLSPGPASSIFIPHAEFTPLSPDKVLFPAITSTGGRELWVTDGTAAGTFSLDLEPGSGSTNFGPLVQVRRVGDVAYFFASTLGRGSGLWKTDGTLAGTQLVLSAPLEPWPDLTAIDEQLFFGVTSATGNLAIHHESATTYLPLASTDPTSSSFPTHLTAVEDRLFFVAEDGDHGRELWRSDGTAGGTQLVADIIPGPNGPDLQWLTPVGAQLYFSAFDSESGSELWTTTGTHDGTRRVRDITPGPNSSQPSDFISWNSQLVFATSEPNTGRELWISDGSEEGTKRLSDLPPGPATSDPSGAMVFDQRLYVLGRTETGEQFLWRYDSADSAPVQLTSSPVVSLPRVAGEQLYFSADDRRLGYEPWISDGTVEGSHLLADVNRTTLGSDPRLLTVRGDTAYFMAIAGLGGQSAELWQTDGTRGGTRAVPALIPELAAGVPISLLAAGFGMYLVQTGSDGTELWKVDANTAKAARLWQTSEDRRFVQALLVLSDDRLFFTASDEFHGTELWVTDGTPDGTQMVRDISRGPDSTSVSQWQEFQGGLLFVAAEQTRGAELWFTDGSDAGTYPVADIRPGPAESGIGSLYVSHELAYFSADDGQHGLEPWISDGTLRGTRMLANVDTRTLGSDPARPTVLGTDVFFAATDTDERRYLWRWNPTADTPSDAPAVVSKSALAPSDLADVDGTLYFSAFHPAYGRELWQSDGTAAGTRLVVDLTPGPIGSSPLSVTGINGDIYFSAIDAVHGREPWWLSALPGDANADREVDFADFAALAAHFGQEGTRRDGDFNGDGIIDFSDFAILAENFG